MNKETIEEAAFRLYPRLINDPYNPMEDDNKEYRDIWISGAKWKSERMYSEKDMKGYAEFCIDCYRLELPCIIPKDWYDNLKRNNNEN